jgi:hypothetical protein
MVLRWACLLLPLLAAPAAPSIERLEFDLAKVPAGLDIKGKVVDGARWKDQGGENLLLITETGPFPSPKPVNEGEVDAEIYAYQFVRRGAAWKPLWRIQDFERNCDLDLMVSYRRGSLTLTDLDRDGIAESAFLYRLACRSDVSPAVLKLMMHEGVAKYALRGATTIPAAEQTEEIMTPDPAFKKAPAAFLPHAVALWKKFMAEVPGE